MDQVTCVFPPEIWLQIVDWFEGIETQPERLAADRPTLCNLTLVSRSLCHFAQPALFRSVSFRISSHQSARIKARVSGLLDLLERRPESANWITSFTCTQGYSTSKSDIKNQLHLVSSLFIRLPSVRFVSFPIFPITPQHVAHLHSLRHLQQLAIGGNLTSPPKDQTWPDYTWPAVPSIVTLLIQTRDQLHPTIARLISAPTLQNLSLSAACFVQELDYVFKNHPTNNFAGLSSLSLTSSLPPSPGAEPRAFFELAPFFHNLTRLQIYTCRTIPPRAIPSSALPLLKYFSGCPPYAAVLVPGRPVEELNLFCLPADNILSVETLTGLSTGSVKPRKLVLCGATWRDGCLAVVADVFPDLTHLELLRLEGYYGDRILRHFAEETQGLSMLHTLRLTTAAFDFNFDDLQPDHQQQVLEALPTGTLHLREIQFGKVVWQADDQGRWKRAVMPPLVCR